MTVVASTIEATVLVGIDWANETHAVHVMDPTGRRRDAFEIAHSRAGLEALVKRLGRFGPAGQVPVAIERPDGRLVDVLLEAGHPVVPVQPNAIKAWRDAEVLSGAKSDPGDAEVIAEYLRLRLRHLKVLEPLSEQTRTLRAVVRARDDLVQARVAPRSGQVNAAQMLAEWGDCREAYDSPEAVCALAGLTPVTKHSGKHHAVHFRWACNTRFRDAVTTFADNSRHASPWAANIYQRAKDRGCDHPHAIRILARAWVRVIWRCWTNGTAYDPNLHNGAQQLTTNAA